MIKPTDLRWIHDGLDAFTIVDHYTIRDAILRDRNAENRYAIYSQIDGDEVHLTSVKTIDDVTDYLNHIA